MKIYTIGFTKTSAENFFNRIKSSDTRALIDTRISNSSQLAGFAKSNDLKYFLEIICNVEYRWEPELAPTEDLLKKYQKKIISWEQYEKEFNHLLEYRDIKKKFSIAQFDNSCLLCSEDKPHYCHRRLVAEYLKINSDENVRIFHL